MIGRGVMLRRPGGEGWGGGGGVLGRSGRGRVLEVGLGGRVILHPPIPILPSCLGSVSG